MATVIDVKEIMEQSARYQEKVGAPFIKSFEKPSGYTFTKDIGKRDFANAIIRANSTKLGPNHYKPVDVGAFPEKDNARRVHFAFNKEKKTSVIDD